MTKEEQRFTAAVAAMQAIIQKGPIHRLYADMPTLISESVEHTIEESVLYADALMKEMDKYMDIVKIDVNNCIVGCDNAYYYSWYKCTQHNCDNDRIDQGDNYCSECGSKIYWVIEGDETLPAYEKDLFANSKNGDGKKITEIDLPYIESFPSQNSNSKKTHDVIVADTVVTKANPDARVFTKNQILNHRIK